MANEFSSEVGSSLGSLNFKVKYLSSASPSQYTEKDIHEYLVVVTLAPKNTPVNEKEVIENFYDKVWYEKAKNWSADNANSFQGSRFLKSIESADAGSADSTQTVFIFHHAFLDKEQRKEYFFNSSAFKDSKEGLKGFFDIKAEFMLDTVSGHGDNDPGG